MLRRRAGKWRELPRGRSYTVLTIVSSECHSSRGPRHPRGSWPHAVRTLRYDETLSETPTGVPRKPAASVHRGQPLGSELDSVAQTAVANSQRNENVRGFARTSPIDPARFADPAQTRRQLTIASHASAVVVLGRSPLHTPARLPRLRALARHTPRRSFVRTRRPRLHLGREIPQFAAFERARGFAASLGVRGIAATARRRAGGVRAAYPR